MDIDRDRLADNLNRVRERIARACRRAGRSAEEVTLVAVTKTVSIETAQRLVELGVRDLGENRPQELWRKANGFPADLRWHLIGHLQRNKIDRTLPLVYRIHSVDSVRLLEALDTQARNPLEVFLEVNCSGEASKSGFAPTDVETLPAVLEKLRTIRVVGLMTMAAYTEDPEACRPTFRLLQTLCADLRRTLAGRHPLAELSMGMSNDFEVAIEEGSTCVRLGTVLYEEAK